MGRGRSIEGTCDVFQGKHVVLHSPINRLKADYIFKMMMQVRDGLCMTANPVTFTSKIVPGYDPLINLRQNCLNEVEVVDPLPIPKINILSPSITDSMQSATMTYLTKMPQADLAFMEEDVAKRAEEKVYRVATDEELAIGAYTYKIIAGEFSPEKDFAVYPAQVGKWFPGMYTIYADSMV